MSIYLGMTYSIMGRKHLNCTTSHWKLANLLSLSFYKSNLYCWFEWSFHHSRIGSDSIANDNHCKQIVQIALILSITFSFVWRTMGIGLSPNNLVSVMRTVTLTLSVAYAFIVWDQIPFAAANLHAGLSSILVISWSCLCFLCLSRSTLGWSIYYILLSIFLWFLCLSSSDLRMVDLLYSIIYIFVAGGVNSNWWYYWRNKPRCWICSLWATRNIVLLDIPKRIFGKFTGINSQLIAILLSRCHLIHMDKQLISLHFLLKHCSSDRKTTI